MEKAATSLAVVLVVQKKKKYPACRPTPGACKERGKGKSWGKKAKKKKNEALDMRKGFLYMKGTIHFLKCSTTLLSKRVEMYVGLACLRSYKKHLADVPIWLPKRNIGDEKLNLINQ